MARSSVMSISIFFIVKKMFMNYNNNIKFVIIYFKRYNFESYNKLLKVCTWNLGKKIKHRLKNLQVYVTLFPITSTYPSF